MLIIFYYFCCKCLNEELDNKDKTDVNQVNEADLWDALRDILSGNNQWNFQQRHDFVKSVILKKKSKSKLTKATNLKDTVWGLSLFNTNIKCWSMTQKVQIILRQIVTFTADIINKPQNCKVLRCITALHHNTVGGAISVHSWLQESEQWKSLVGI